MCCFFSYIERKKIAAEGRRLSTAVRRASTKLRRGSSAATDAPEKEMTDKDIERAADTAAGSKNEKNFLQDQMKYQRDINASATSIQIGEAGNAGNKVN